MIKRHITNSLLESLSYFPVVGIIGPRQVGKTTLSKYISKIIEKESIYVDLENPRDIVKLTDPVIFFENNINKCIILDEIQLMPELFSILRSMVDMKREPARFIILGSASPKLIRSSSESLAGRIAYEELTPFNILEVQSDIFNHWFSGGFPNAFLSPNNSIRHKWLNNFIQTYVERDLPMLGLNINRNTIRKLWVMLAHMHGNVINMSNIAKSLELSSTTIKKYLSFLEGAFLIRLLYPYSSNTKKRLVKSPKIYIRDTGILHFLLSIPDFNSLESTPIIGASWEGYAIEQIIQRLHTDTQYYFYRTQDGSECDMIITKSTKPIMSIEIKYTAAPKITKGTKIAFESINSTRNYVITPNTDEYMLHENINVCNLKTFLRKYL